MSNFRKKEEDLNGLGIVIEDGVAIWKTEAPILQVKECIHLRVMLGDAGYDSNHKKRNVDILCRDCGFVWSIGLNSLSTEASIDPLYVTENWYEFLTVNDKMLERLAEYLWEFVKEVDGDNSIRKYEVIGYPPKSYYRKHAAEIIKILKTV